MPDEISLKIYIAYYNDQTWEFQRADTVHYERVKKGELSPYMLIKDESLLPNVIYYIQPLDIATQAELPSRTLKFDPVTGMGFQLSMNPGNLGTEKFYINSIVPQGDPSFIHIFSDRIISY